MHVYDRFFFPRGPLLRRAARWGINTMRRVAPGLADRLAPLRRVLLKRVYDDPNFQSESAEQLVSRPQAEVQTASKSESARVRGEEAVTAVPSVPKKSLRDLSIVHIIGSLQAGGAERQVVYTLAGLRARGYRRAELIVTQGLERDKGHYLPSLQKEGVPVTISGRVMDPAFEARVREAPEVVERVRGVPGFLRPQVPDLVGELLIRRPAIVHCWLDHTNLWGGIAAAIAGVPSIILSTRNVSPVHMPHLREPWFEQWYGVLAARPGVTFVNNSQAGALDYAQWLGLPPERFRVILNGVDFSHLEVPPPSVRAQMRRDAGIPPTARLLTGVFRMADEKQPLTFVEVAEKVLDRVPDAHVVLVGTGRLERDVRRRMRGSRHASRMHHLGRRSDVPAILAESHAFLLTSKAEGTPNVLLEAQHLGVPVVTTAAGGAGDAIDDGVTGVVRPIGDVSGLTEAVVRLFHDASWHRELAASGPRRVAERFGLDRMIDETEALYSDLQGAAD